MAFLFGRYKQRTNAELAKSTKELVQRLIEEEKPSPKTEEELARNLMQMKLVLQGTPDTDISPDQVVQLIQLLVQEDLLLPLSLNIHKLPFESRKDTQVILSTIFRFKHPPSAAEPIALKYICTNQPEVVVALCNGYNHRESAMPCGTILREALKHDVVAAIILFDEPMPDGSTRGLVGIDVNAKVSGNGLFWKFFEWIDKGAFEVSADAFSTFREILTRHKKLVGPWLETNFDLFFEKYNRILIQSDSYVTKRQSIKMLGEILLDRANYNVMTMYVQHGDHLKICMKLLKDDRRMVNYEAFHVFKIFIANPSKSLQVQRILINNRDKLIRFLPTFLDERTEDDQFTDEKKYLVRQIEMLPPAPVPPAPTPNLYNGPGAITAEIGGGGGGGRGRRSGYC